MQEQAGREQDGNREGSSPQEMEAPYLAVASSPEHCPKYWIPKDIYTHAGIADEVFYLLTLGTLGLGNSLIDASTDSKCALDQASFEETVLREEPCES